MTDIEFYEAIGGDYKDALSRLMKEALIHKFILKFRNDPSYDNLKNAIENKDIEASFSAAHSLKGVAANLGFMKLFKASSDLVEQLRPRQETADPILFEAVEVCYKDIIHNLGKIEE